MVVRNATSPLPAGVKVHVGAVDIRDQLELVLQRFADVVRLTT